MPIENDYNPKYIGDLSDLPISGPDDYNDEPKRRAAFHAETQLELDVNDGEEIGTNNITNAHEAAALNLATHVLTHAAEEPSDVTLGDMESGGGTITDYSSVYRERYDMLVEKILSSGIGESQGSNPVVYVNNGVVGDDSSTQVQ